ncbi:ATPase family associated with various cellular activities (AAA) family protein [Cryptosporidium meleagridis]|uniref:ATPase family associated with various cellular activities (AAA) family protein n=1 Tax=Cryptosporidium meleagridis TaxID=93969 RepID=A0A2P4YZR7_9CRYT|nr:ATPase family associated with various cellular activities (AAA) family protein [Cryptosporidium meleagridis]
MERYIIPCNIEVKEDLKDGISLISRELVNKLTNNNFDDTRNDRIILLELNLENLKFFTFFKINNEIDPCKEDIVYIHSGLSCISHFNKGYIKYIKNENCSSTTNKITISDIVFSGPLFSQLSTQSDIFLLNYRNLLVEGLKRQLYYYLKLTSTEYNLKDMLNNLILPFLINEKYYFFQIQYIKENEQISKEFENNYMKLISNLLIIPNVNKIDYNPNMNNNISKSLEIESFMVKNINNIKNIINNNNNIVTSTFYLDTTYILNKYVTENNISIKVLKNIKNNIIERVKNILEEITRFNISNLENKISINIFMYNYITSFSNLSINDNLIGQLEEHFSKFTCIKKLILIEYSASQGPEFVNILKKNNISSKPFFYNTYHLKCLMAKNHFHTSGAKHSHVNEELLPLEQMNEVELDENELLCGYLKLKKELNEYISILLLDKNYDTFLELMYYQSLNKHSFEQFKEGLSSKGDVLTGINMVNWIIRVCFGVSDRELIYKVVEILFRNLVIDNKLYNNYLQEKEMLLFKNRAVGNFDGKMSTLDAGDLSLKDESVKSVLQQVDDQLIIYKLFENEYSKINEIMNQQFTPRILIYNSRNNLNGSKLSIVKQELIKYVQKQYINYKLVHKHILALLSPYVGQSEENIRQLFNTNIPTILILEGIDVISSNFIVENNKTDTFFFQDHMDLSSTNNSKVSKLNPNFINYSPNLFNDISFRINSHKERIKNIFNLNWTSQNLMKSNRLLGNNQNDDQFSSKNSNDSRTLLTTLLLCLDNVEKKNQNVIVIAFSSKHILELDESITRAGRLDIHIPV